MNSFTDRLNDLFKQRQSFINDSLKEIYENIQIFAELLIEELKNKQIDQEKRSFELLNEIKILEERKNEIDLKINKITLEIEKLINDD